MFAVIARLQAKLPKSFAMAGKVNVSCVFKDFTFTSLNDDEVFQKLQKAFPQEDWQKPYEAAKAAMERKL